MNITPLYAALLALLFFYLSVLTFQLRRKYRIAVGDGGNEKMLRAMRVHANFAEYVPFCLLLIFMLESLGGHFILVHALCICLLSGRLAHAYGVSKVSEDLRYRRFGMSMTFLALLGSAGCLIFIYARNLL